MMKSKTLATKTKIAVLVAVAFILYLMQVPIIPAFPWLQLDLSDVAVFLGGFAFGPISALIIVLFKNILNLVLTGSTTGGVGELANFMIGASFSVPAAYIYWRNKSKKNAIIGMLVGSIMMVVVAILSNVYIILPLYNMKLEGAALTNYILAGLIPFNSIKAIVVCSVTFVLYKKLSLTLFKVEPELGEKKSLEEVK